MHILNSHNFENNVLPFTISMFDTQCLIKGGIASLPDDMLSRRRGVLKVKFTEEEDAKLQNLVMQYGTRDWIHISKLMGTRNPRQCRERWNNYVNPSLRTDPWTPDEDILLDAKYAEFGPRWNKISKFFKNRSDNNIRNRWMMISRHRAKSLRNPSSQKASIQRVENYPGVVPAVVSRGNVHSGSGSDHSECSVFVESPPVCSHQESIPVEVVKGGGPVDVSDYSLISFGVFDTEADLCDMFGELSFY